MSVIVLASTGQVIVTSLLAPNLQWQIEAARICATMGKPLAKVLGRSPDRALLPARHAVAQMLRARGNSYPQIARMMGDRDHTTIMDWVSETRRERRRSKYKSSATQLMARGP